MFSRIIGLLFIAALSVQADEAFRSLKVKNEVYTNVTVTSVTATDIYFTHAGGLASAKLKDLEPTLQQHFHYNAARSSEIEKAEIQATADFHARLAQQKPQQKSAPAVQTQAADPDDFVAPALKARSVRGGPPPQFAVEKWITEQPATDGKFVLIDFWATWCGPCRESIPELNAFQAKFADRLAVIGVSDESEQAIHKMTSPTIGYAVAIDPEDRMARALEITAIPHCILIDPSGIVRYEGNPLYLNVQILKRFLDKYSK